MTDFDAERENLNRTISPETQRRAHEEYKKIEQVIDALPQNISSETMASMMVAVAASYGIEGTEAKQYFQYLADFAERLDSMIKAQEAVEQMVRS